MLKSIQALGDKAEDSKNATDKFTNDARLGTRLFLSRKFDSRTQLRIDAGYHNEDTKQLNVVLQANKEASKGSLKEFVRKNSAHAKVATATFDTSAVNQKAEFRRMIIKFEENYKRNNS